MASDKPTQKQEAEAWEWAKEHATPTAGNLASVLASGVLPLIVARDAARANRREQGKDYASDVEQLLLLGEQLAEALHWALSYARRMTKEPGTWEDAVKFSDGHAALSAWRTAHPSEVKR